MFHDGVIEHVAGGTDAVSFTIENRLTNIQRFAVSKFARSVRGQEEAQSVFDHAVRHAGRDSTIAAALQYLGFGE